MGNRERVLVDVKLLFGQNLLWEPGREGNFPGHSVSVDPRELWKSEFHEGQIMTVIQIKLSEVPFN